MTPPCALSLVEIVRGLVLGASRATKNKGQLVSLPRLYNRLVVLHKCTTKRLCSIPVLKSQPLGCIIKVSNRGGQYNVKI